MERVRMAIFGAVAIVLSIVGVAVGSVSPSARLNETTWPTAMLLLSEVQTSGASASDEFIELTNAGGATVDLAGLEVVYVTSTGGTITRKATWTGSQPLEPGRHLLIVNSAGAYAAIGNLAYSGGLAATGGAVVLRLVAGAPVDAVGWGDATNSFLESATAPAPPASSSLERRPGGLAGNTTDSNDNAADWFVQSSPNPQGLAAPPVPATPPWPSPEPTGSTAPPDAGGSAGMSPSSGTSEVPSSSVPGDSSPGPSESFAAPTASSGLPTADPSPSTPTAAPTPAASASPPIGPLPTASGSPGTSHAPTSPPSSSPTSAPSSSPTAAPSASEGPTASPSASLPSVAPSTTPGATVSIAEARAQANDSPATISGVLTTKLGALDSGRVGFVQDDTAGIALYLDAVPAVGLPAGTVILVPGTLVDRYAARTLRMSLADIAVLGQASLPDPIDLPTGSIGEAVEGRRVQVIGTTIGSPTSYADGLGILVDDGSGAVRAIVGPAALGSVAIPSGTRVAVIGPVGQRDSSGTGTTAYRIHATELGELQILPAPSPSGSPSPPASSPPTAAPSPSGAGPTAAPGTSAAPSLPPTASPAPTNGTLISIRDARSRPIGSSVIVVGIVSAEVARVGSTSVVALADASGGLLVRVPAGGTAPARGSALQVSGPISAPYGQLELRPLAAGVRETGTGQLPSPLRISAADLGEATEGRLVELVGTAAAAAKRSSTGDLSIDLRDPAGATFRVMATAASGLVIADLPVGSPLRVVGIVGQRASRSAALDGYRLWLRDRSDVRVEGIPGSAGGSATGADGVAPTTPEAIGIATALGEPDGTAVLVDATVTAGASLLDTSGRRIVIEDGTAAIEVLLPDGSTAPTVGTRLLVDGRTAHAWGAPRLRATTLTTLPGNGPMQPESRTAPPRETEEWRLIRVSGTIGKVERLGDRWRAELLVGGKSGPAMPILGQAGAAIPSTAVIVGRSVTVTGIVKRPYPTATDQRFAILPRTTSDLASGPSGSGGSAGAAATRTVPGGTEAGTAGVGSSSNVGDVTPDTDLAALLPRLGQRVRVGGLIAALSADGFGLDDGTAIARVILHGDAIELLPYLRVRDAIAASGRVERLDGALAVVVEEAGDLVRVGDLGQAVPIGRPSVSPEPPVEPADASLADAVSSVLQPHPGPLGLVAMAALSLASLLGTLLRRRRARRLLREAITARLATLRPSGE
ncbi:MAG TPA: lamin tail domain-containing protein [Candidatus Eisenbacteria bacterium]|nr:lamin tail domain-containing protein [Candidatus Eisenbacteria bacterium]